VGVINPPKGFASAAFPPIILIKEAREVEKYE
jgi:hypothetical protein